MDQCEKSWPRGLRVACCRSSDPSTRSYHAPGDLDMYMYAKKLKKDPEWKTTAEVGRMRNSPNKRIVAGRAQGMGHWRLTTAELTTGKARHRQGPPPARPATGKARGWSKESLSGVPPPREFPSAALPPEGAEPPPPPPSAILCRRHPLLTLSMCRPGGDPLQGSGFESAGQRSKSNCAGRPRNPPPPPLPDRGKREPRAFGFPALLTEQSPSELALAFRSPSQCVNTALTF
jgi:hypothetical protein